MERGRHLEKIGARVTKNPTVRLVLADVDGTLVTDEKVLTKRAIVAVRELHEAGILFSLTSGRPPRGMEMFIEPLNLSLPFAAFNGGQILSPAFDTLVEHVLDQEVLEEIVADLAKAKLETWFYAGSKWYVPSRDGSHVDRESATVGFAPTLMSQHQTPPGSIVKVVGVSDDHHLIQRVAGQIQEAYGQQVSAEASQPYYLDITHPLANKGTVVSYLAEQYHLDPQQIATIGDMPNDVDMFTVSGLSIAMGNAAKEVRDQAHRVTASNNDEGFAKAMEEFVLATKERS
ncbi:Cof-type HAD-IIB family hydrolase [Ferrimicrobium sp.]|uniref:Cof-type HAD-IIB family hydrolase n=1 Tax=Ferrimicrobium sp. TaxID=2926050 RepID=UPI002610E4FA|nr:Cof-type HAD-IIB family hydrolase [Ferrimicrobium sp.]